MQTTSRTFLALAACGAVVAVLATAEHERDSDEWTKPPGRENAAAVVAGPPLELRRDDRQATRAAVEPTAGASRAAPGDAAAAPQDATADVVGMTDSERLTALMRAHEMIALSAELPDPELVERAELNFIRRCIGTILHDRGRARFPDEEVRRRGGFSMGASENGEFSFVQDGALYQYDRGEFPVHDIAYDRRVGKPVERPPDMEDRIQALMLEALDTIDAPAEGAKGANGR